MAFLHKNLAEGRWRELSLAQQMGNIGSEVGRAGICREKGDEQRFQGAIERAFELLDLTVIDPRWKTGRKEIARVRELLGDAFYGGIEYRTSFKDLDKYFLPFALKARGEKA